MGKVQIKEFCQQYSQNVTKEITLTLNTLETDILKLQELAHLPGNQKSDVESLIKNKNRVIHALHTESRALLTDPKDICKRAVTFYESLYKNEPGPDYRDDSDFFDDLPQASEEVNAKISGALTMGELHKALQGMELGKAPVIDGLPVNFYKSFWSELGEDLLMVLNDSLAGGLMPLSCRRAVLTLLPKKGDLMDIKYWGLVSLLCSDYKLLSEVLATRLAEVMDQVLTIHTVSLVGQSLIMFP